MAVIVKRRSETVDLDEDNDRLRSSRHPPAPALQRARHLRDPPRPRGPRLPRRRPQAPPPRSPARLNRTFRRALTGVKRTSQFKNTLPFVTHLRHETRRDHKCPTHLTRPLSRMLVWPLGILAD